MKADTPDQHPGNISGKYLLALAAWSVLIAASLAWNVYQGNQEVLSNALAIAQTNQAEQREYHAILAPSLGLIWLLGLLGGGIFYRRERSYYEKHIAAEMQLSESELKYRTLADSGQALIWTSGADKLCDYFNKVWLEFTGRSMAQELGNGWTEGVHSDDYQHCLDVYVSAFDKREKFSMAYRLRRHDGEYRWMQDDGCPRYDRNGEFSGYIGYCLDITKSRLAEEERLETLNRLHKITQLAPGVVFQFRLRSDGSTCMPYVSDAFRNLFRLNPAEVCEDASKAIMRTHPDDLENVMASIQASARGLTSWKIEYRLKFDDGTVRWVFGSSLPQLETDGSILWHGFITDITERKQSDELLARIVHDMGERIKEIACLRDITLLLLRNNKNVEKVLGSCVRRIPGGWLDPSRICARIRLDEKTFETRNFQETTCKLAAKIPVSAMKRAVVEVFYMGDESELANNPFLGEEYGLIKAIATQLGLFLERRWAEDKLKRFSIELEQVNSVMTSNLLVAKDVMSYIMRSDGLRDSQIRHFLRPTEQFCGDMIAVSRDNKGDLRVMLADVSGHGLQAALFLLPIFRVFRAMVSKGLPTCDIVTEMNQTMRGIAETGHFIAAAVAHISHDCSSIEIWNGGIPTAFYVQKNGEVHKFLSRHMPLGVAGADTFKSATEVFHALPGALMLCSDGLTEAENACGEPFGEERLETLLRTTKPDKLFDDIISALETHLDGGNAHDDLSILLAQCGD